MASRGVSIGARIGLALVLVSLVTAGFMAVVFTVHMDKVIDQAQRRELDGLYGQLAASIRAEGRTAEILSAFAASIPDAVTAMAEGDRDRLGAMFLPSFKALKRDYAVEQFQFHTPPATSFLRLHKMDKFGDDLSGFRATVVATNKVRRPTSGLETGVAGFGLRGMVPVMAEGGRHLGSVEFGMSFGQAFFDAFKKQYGVDVTLYLTGGQGLARFAGTLGDQTILGADELSDALAGKPVARTVPGRSQAVLGRAVSDFSGKAVGVAEIVMDNSHYMAERAASRRSALMFALGALALASLIGFAIARTISRPIREMTAAMDRFAHRDFTVEVPALDRADEIGLMARSVQFFKERGIELKKFEDERERTLAELGRREEQLRADMYGHLQGVVEAAIQSNEAIVVLARMMRDVHDASERSQTMASAIEEMVASVQQIAGTSDAAADQAQGAEQAAGQGVRASERAVTSMETIHHAVEQAELRVDSLSRLSAEIGEVVRMISDIAGRTNLLALNATIEAARAGEAGKGFAVVATEVKNLAHQTAKATEEIGERIGHLQGGMSGIIEVMKESAAAVDGGRDVIADLRTQLAAISGSINNVTGQMQEIAGILAQQGRAADEVAGGTAAIASLSARNNDEIGAVLSAMDRANEAIEKRVHQFAANPDPHTLIEVAKNDHVAFKRRVIERIMGRNQVTADELPDHTACRLGRWYERITDPVLRGSAAYTALLEPHRRVHSAGKAALTLFEAGREDEALAAIDELNDASHQVLRLLDELKRQIDISQ